MGPPVISEDLEHKGIGGVDHFGEGVAEVSDYLLYLGGDTEAASPRLGMLDEASRTGDRIKVTVAVTRDICAA